MMYCEGAADLLRRQAGAFRQCPSGRRRPSTAKSPATFPQPGFPLPRILEGCIRSGLHQFTGGESVPLRPRALQVLDHTPAYDSQPARGPQDEPRQ